MHGILGRMSGPSWVGIGAQRCGTDWVSRLLVQHPDVDFGTNGKKEQSALQRIPDGSVTDEEYLALFPDDGIRRGDWSPRYLPSMLVPHVAKRLIRDDAPLLVLLRDPVERFGSAMRHAKNLGKIRSDYHERPIIRAHQFGQYGSSLEGWASVFGRDRIHVQTYEQAQEDVQRVCDVFWDAMGLKPHRLENAYGRVKAPTEGSVKWEWPEGARETLVQHFLPQVLWVRDHWGVDVKRWRSFEGLV